MILRVSKSQWVFHLRRAVGLSHLLVRCRPRGVGATIQSWLYETIERDRTVEDFHQLLKAAREPRRYYLPPKVPQFVLKLAMYIMDAYTVATMFQPVTPPVRNVIVYEGGYHIRNIRELLLKLGATSVYQQIQNKQRVNVEPLTPWRFVK